MEFSSGREPDFVKPSEELRKFGPKKAGHPAVGAPCIACKMPFKEGDYTTIISVGPGNDPEARARAREGRPYNTVGFEIHWACATGEE